jgi:hypothetical protein
METMTLNTWEGIVNILITVLENGDEAGKKIAREEIRRMAKVADLGIELTANKASLLAKEV